MDMDKVEVVITREQLEWIYDRKFSDVEWVVLSNEIENIVEHYIETDVPYALADLDNLVKDYQEEN
jgi:predicted HAD superfamily phosphohydrolase YqeG